MTANHAVVDEYITELKSRISAREQLRTENVSATESPLELDTSLLDSSLKRNSAFIRRLRCFSATHCDQVLGDMLALNLARYLSEAATALVDAPLKMADVAAAVRVCSQLHRRYPEFSPLLLLNWQRVLPAAGGGLKGTPLCPARLRVQLRYYGELVAVQAVPRREGLQLLGSALTALVALDRHEHACCSVVLTFCRHCGELYAGLVPTKIRLAASATHREGELPSSELVAADKQRNVRQLLLDYLSSLSRHVLSEHSRLLKLRRSARHVLQNRGELSADKQQQLEEMEGRRDRLLVACRQLAELLDEEEPELPEDEQERAEQLQLARAAESGVVGDEACVWEDEEQRAFYTNLPDLRSQLPATLYHESETSAPLSTDDGEEPAVEESDATSGGESRQLEELISSLGGCVSRAMVDQAAVDFCRHLNTRGNRKRLARALAAVPRHRLDLLPLHARLVATLHSCMPDIAPHLATLLTAEFSRHVRTRQQTNLESKLKVVRFIGELVKFRLYGWEEALWCLRQLLNHFSHHHIDMACALLETCGRLLYRSTESHLLTRTYVEQMVRQRTASTASMSAHHATLIDNMYHSVVPREEVVRQALPPLPPLHQYVLHLLTRRLERGSVKLVAGQLRRLNWQCRETADWCVRCLSSAWLVRFGQVRCLAGVVAALARYRPHMGVRVTDRVLELVRVTSVDVPVTGGEHAQRRTSSARLLSELYNYRLLDTAALLHLMYSLLAAPVLLGSGEPPLRVTLLLLQRCGAYMQHSASTRRHLDQLLAVLQRYYWQCMAAAPLPVRLQHQFDDTLLSLRPHTPPCSSLQQAEKRLQQMLESLQKRLGTQLPSSAHETAPVTRSPSPSDDPADREEEEEEDEEAAVADDDDAEEEIAEETAMAEEEEHWPGAQHSGDRAAAKLAPRLISCPEDDQFQSAYDSLVFDSLSERARDCHKPCSDHGLLSALTSTAVASQPPPPLSGDTFRLTVLTRRAPGTRQPVHRHLLLPGQSPLAESMRSRARAELAERQHMKLLTLSCSERQLQEQMVNTDVPHAKQHVTPAPAHRSRGAPDADRIFGSRRSQHR